MDIIPMPLQAKTLLNIVRKLATHVRAIRADQDGVAAIEFSFFVGILAFAMLNVADISIYIYKRMQVENASQMGAQAAWIACDIYHLPATLNCTTLQNAVTNAVQSTSLSTQVSLQSGYPSEGYYCLNSGSLVKTFNITTVPKPLCPDGTQAEDYITIATTFSYAPLFPKLTVAGTFATPITKSAMMRLD